MSLSALVLSLFSVAFPNVNSDESLHHAARTGNVIYAYLALQRWPDTVNSPERPRWGGNCLSPVQLAAEYNNTGVLKLLLAHGGKVNDAGEAGVTPLQLATRWGSPETVEFLLSHGATLDLFSAVVLNKRAEVEKMLRLAKELGVLKAAVNAKSSGCFDKDCLLNWAVLSGRPEMIDLLVRSGADVNSVRSPSWWYGEFSPLHMAVRFDRSEVAEALLKPRRRIGGKRRRRTNPTALGSGAGQRADGGTAPQARSQTRQSRRPSRDAHQRRRRSPRRLERVDEHDPSFGGPKMATRRW